MEIVNHTKKVKTRKPHMCFACGRLHPIGEEMSRQVNTYDGQIGSVYSCKPCDIIMDEFPELCYDEYCFPEGCVAEIPANCFNKKEREEYYKNPSPWKILDIMRQPITEG